jgi:hypothetical protein
MRHVAVFAGILLTLLGLTLLMGSGAQAETWHVYANPRFGSVIEYPERFRPLPSPENGDGQAFEAPDGGRLSISGSYNINDDTPESYERFLRAGEDNSYADVKYRAIGRDWLVLSGLRDGKLYYDRLLFDQRSNTVHHLAITYPPSQRESYDPVVTRMARSLRVAR